MSSRPELRLDWCSYQAAKYAVEHWHYSKTMPMGKLVKVGVWEAGEYKGVLIFGMGAAPQAGIPYKLNRFQICELVRVALNEHLTPVSRIVSIALGFLKIQSRGLRLVVSYADPAQGHMGIIYQAGGWVYVGLSVKKWRANGQHNRIFGTSITEAKRRLGPDVRIEWDPEKHKYLMPLNDEIRQRILPLSKPYPKRQKDSSEPSAIHAEEGGAAPTLALQDLFPMRTRMKANATR